jgi:cytochrome P450
MVLQFLLYAFVIIIFVLLVVIYFKLIHPQKQLYNAFRAQGVPGEPFVPLLGQVLEWSRYRQQDMPFSFQNELIKKHGHVFIYGYGPIIRLACIEPDLLADILSRSNTPNYVKSVYYSAVVVPLIGQHGLLVVEGDEHERARRMINPAFYHSNLKSMVSIIIDRTTKVIESIAFDDQNSKPVNLQVLFNTLTLSIIASTAFGADLETNAHAKDVMCRTYTEMLDAAEYRLVRLVNIVPFLSRLPFWRKNVLDSGMAKLNEFIDKIISDRRQDKSTSMCSGADLLDLLLSATDDQGQSFSDQEIKEESLTFVFAGSETTGNLMVWMLYVLMTHNDVLQACREEVDKVLRKGTDLLDEHLSELVVCEAVINETLRLYPPVPYFVRTCIHEHTIGTKHQIRIPKDTLVFVNSYILHRRSDLWPRPLEFDYTRWMRDPKTGLKPKLSHPFAYLPFAAGSRNCIGQNFALVEAKIMLAMFIQRCNFEIVPGQKIVPDVKLTMRTKYGLWANISKRQI